MKIARLCMIIITVICLITIGYSMNYYTRYDCVVYSIEDNIITVEDNGGQLWSFIAEDNHSYKQFDKVNLKMHNNYTEDNIQDDIIMEVK